MSGRALRAAQRLSELIETHPIAVLILLLLGYVSMAVPTAIVRPLWMDELMEYYICAQPSFTAVWDSLRTAPPTTDPPLHYFLTHLCIVIFGNREWAMRLPSLLAFLIAAACCFEFVRRRLGAASASIAVTLLLASGTLYYASEARPYAIVMACCGALFLSWQSVCLGRHRAFNRAAMAISLSAAILAHYYGVLLGFPVLVGEVVRSVERRRIEWLNFLSLAAGYLGVLMWLPFLHAAFAWKSHIWFVPGFEDVMDMLATLADVRFLVLFLLAMFFIQAVAAWMRRDTDEPQPAFRIEEAVAVFTLVLLPFIGFFLSKFVSRLFVTRYVVSSGIGIAVAAVAVTGTGNRARRPLTALLAVLLFCFLVSEKMRYLRYQMHDRRDFNQMVTGVASLPSPVVVASAHDFVQFWFYGSTEARKRIVWLADQSAELQYLGTDTTDRMLANLQRVERVHIEDLQHFVQAHPSFYVYRKGPFPFVLGVLLSRGAQVSYLGKQASGDFFHVDAKPPAARK